MRIFTYPNPFEINKNAELWQIITKYPHFCASDTLVQGLETEYGRDKFGILRTVNTLITNVFGTYTNNPQNDIQMFLTVLGSIHDLPNPDSKASFSFNKADVMESVKFLIMLGCQSSEFKGELTEEQKTLLDIYDKVLQSGAAGPLKQCMQMSKSDFIIAARTTINDEIAYLCHRTPAYLDLGISLPLFTPREGYEAIEKIITYLAKKMNEAPYDPFTPRESIDDLTRARYIRKLITETEDAVFDKIIIHGVHKFTPTIYTLIQLLERIGIEVIFLINYAGNLPNVYRTWREVYSWCGTKLEYQSDLDYSAGSKLGSAIADVIEGKRIFNPPDEEVTVFNNLTSFTDREVRRTFKNAKQNLNGMRTQYYAVRGESSNEILKMYFPEQFNQKPFLSYPIGQFILGIYQMWDFKRITLIINEKSLSECAVSNLYKGDGDDNMLEIIRKTKLYFSDVETIGEYYNRIGTLETALRVIAGNNRYAPLTKLSFFNITHGQLAQFKSFLEFIEDIAIRLFRDSSPNIDFGKHFRTLMEIISVPSLGSGTLTKTEQALIDEITQRLGTCPEGKVKGNIEDVKDALHFFLAANKKGDTSSWIVRDFEQIDGAVLLRRRSKATDYHFALLSNAHMTAQDDDVLPWPLTIGMFIGYTNVESAVPVVTKGLLERRAFLKFSLFYGANFTKCGVKLSFIREENGEEQTPYYLLKVLGLKECSYREKERTTFLTDEDTISERCDFSAERLAVEARELFSICPYKFMQHEVLKAPIEYSGDYHVKYFVSSFMAAFIAGNHNLRREQQEHVLELEFTAIQRLFPFWDNIIFHDIEMNTRNQLLSMGREPQADIFRQLAHEKRKENFLIAQWKDPDSDVKQMIFNKPGLSPLIENYMKSIQLYPSRNELPHKKVCENCNFREICLRDYYEAHGAAEAMEGPA